jgi:hypothetical protein
VQWRPAGPAAVLFACAVFLVAFRGIAAAQDLEPRAYAAAPVGVNFLVLGFGSSSGDVVVDPSLPIEDVKAKVNSAVLGIGTTLNLFGRTALAVAALPYATADVSGRVGENAASISRSGLGDPRLKFSVNLRGGRALTVREFARTVRPTIIGVSLTVIPPIGQYYPAKLINLGANRWAFKPEVGVSRLIRRWTIDGYAGVWMATANDEFYPGSSLRTQRPIVAVQGHASYTMKPGLWAALDGTWYSGGRTTVDGVDKNDLQRNSRVGATLSLPLARQQSFKVAGTSGASTRFGADFKTIAVAWQLSWFH